ncbi:MAG TPA: ribosomal protein S18-alanine N-acetyltransferase [Clostridiales bacterium]|nr:ribosomal protein S18-alanine N-acetyltransferase [Clostridiales bacterium]
MYTYYIQKTGYIFIEPIRSYDIDKVLEIEKLCFSVPWSEESFRLEIEKNRFARYLVVKHEGEVVGYGGMWLIIDEAHITNIAIHPNYRRRGIGRFLLISLMKEAVKYGIKSMTLEVRVSNYGAQALYSELGFVKGGIRKGYYGDTQEDALIMWNDDIEATLRHWDNL